MGSEVVHDRTLSQDIGLVEWCDRMDLVAVVVSHVEVSVHRLNWQRVVSLERSESEIGALAWSPDGRWLVTGEEDGWIRVFHVEGGKLQPGKVNIHTAARCFDWVEPTRNPSRDGWQYMELSFCFCSPFSTAVLPSPTSNNSFSKNSV